MAYNTDLEKRLESAFELFPEEIRSDISTKKMFGGLSFLYKNKMTVGIIKEDLVVRVVEEKMDEQLAKTFARPMNFTKKPMKEFIFVSEMGYASEEQLQYWIELGLEHAIRTLKLN